MEKRELEAKARLEADRANAVKSFNEAPSASEAHEAQLKAVSIEEQNRKIAETGKGL